MKKSTHLIFLIFFAWSSYGQAGYEVAKIEKLKIDGYHAQFDPEGGRILYTSKNFKGLKLYDLSAHTEEVITDQKGAGYQPAISDEEIVFHAKDHAKSLSKVNLKSKKHQKIEVRSEKPKASQYMAKQSARLNGELISAGVSENLESIVLVSSDGTSRHIAPLGQEDYISISLSPDRTKVLFRVSGLGSYISDLDGAILRSFGNVEFPTWVNNHEVLYTKTKDDGYNYLSSEVYIADMDSKAEANLTRTTAAIALNPSISKDEKKVVFNTPKGEMYMIHLQ